MIIFPAIDIKGGNCVRLLKGNFKKITKYKKSPVEQANIFFNLGFNNIHIVDLDGALEGKLVNKTIIKEICKNNKIKIQLGGGVRSLKSVEELLNLGIDKVIVGSAAVENIQFLKDACKEYKNKIVLSVDVRKNFLAVSGWKTQTNILASEFVKKIESFGVSRIIYTDINKDGTKTGPNIKDTLNLSKLTNIPVVISGGISSIDDIKFIKKKHENINGIVVGKALYDGNINIEKLSTLI